MKFKLITIKLNYNEVKLIFKILTILWDVGMIIILLQKEETESQRVKDLDQGPVLGSHTLDLNSGSLAS